MTSVDDVPTPPLRWRTLVAAVTVGAALGALVVWWSLDDPPGLAEPDRAAAAEALVDAVARSGEGEFTAVGSFRRIVEGEVRVEDPVVVVQRPPDRLTLGFGSWDGVVDGRRVACRRDGLDGPFLDCQWLGPGDIAESDADIRRQLEGLVAGADPAYRVTDDGDGCFRLVLDDGQRFEPAYGRRADLCFDPATGAEVQRRIERDGAIDELVLGRVRAGVGPDGLPSRR